jgi:two-component system alkaline phosphatase synthesis response regulator PhoP
MAKILIVEDDRFLRELYHDIISKEGYQVDTAEDGEEAFEKMRKGSWDLVLLDIVLPKMDGIEIMKKLQIDPPATPNKSIVFLTNLDKDQKIKEAMQYGNGYLIKSQLTPGDFINEVKLYLPKE